MLHHLLLASITLLQGTQSQVLIAIASIGNGEDVLTLMRVKAVTAASVCHATLLLLARQHFHDTFVATTGQKLLGRM